MNCVVFKNLTELWKC